MSPPTTSKLDPTTGESDHAESALGDATLASEDENMLVDLGRLAWLGTVLACLIAVLILVTQGYYGYALVTFTVALAAAINLF